MFSKIGHIIKWILGIIAVLIVLVMFLIFYFPPTQKWLTDKSAEALSEYLHTEVTIGIISPSLPHHLMAENLCVYDQQGDTLFALAHVDASVPLLPLLKNEIIIRNAQLFGYDIRLVKPDSLSPANYEFLLEAFQSKDSTSTPLNLQLQNLKFRNGNIRYDRLDMPSSTSFSTAHLHLQDLAFVGNATIVGSNLLTFDIQDLTIKNLNENFRVKNLDLNATCNLQETSYIIHDLILELPQSKLHLCGKYLADNLELQVKTEPLNLSDFSLFQSAFDKVPTITDGTIIFHANNEQFSLDTLQMSATGCSLLLTANGTFTQDSLMNTSKCQSADVQLQELTILPDFIAQNRAIFGDSTEISNILARLGALYIKGNAEYSPTGSVARLDALSDVGSVTGEGTLLPNEAMTAHIEASDVNLSKLLTTLLPWSIEHFNAAVDLSGNPHQGIQEIVAHAHDATSECRFNLDASLSAPHHISFNTTDLDALEGDLHIDSLILPDEKEPLCINNLNLQVSNVDEEHHITLNSDFANVDIHGNFNYGEVPLVIQRALHQDLPTLFPVTSHPQRIAENEIHLNASIQQAPLLEHFLGNSFRLLQPLICVANIIPQDKVFELKASAPAMSISNQELRNIVIDTHQEEEALKFRLDLLHANITATDSLNVTLKANAINNSIKSELLWNTLTPKGYDGQLASTSTFQRDSLQNIHTQVHVLPTSFSIAGTPWKMHEADIRAKRNDYTINDIKVSNGNKFLGVEGSIADDGRDSITVTMNDIQIEHVLNLVKFKALNIAGNVSGEAVLNHLKTKPQIGSNLLVKDLEINKGKMGDFTVDFGFGRKKEKSIDFIGNITEPMRGEITGIDGFIDLGDKALDLKVDAHNLNIDFLNHFTKNFFNRLHARTTGLCNIFGTFRDLDLQGNMQLDTFAVTMDVCGARYHALPGDSILLRPGEIEFRHVHILDDLAGTDNRKHAGEVNGLVTHTKLRRFYYDINIATNDILTFNKPHAGEFSAYVFTEGNIRVSGAPSSLEVNINAAPTAGSTIVYDLTTPDATTNNEFIRFIDKDAQIEVPEIKELTQAKQKVFVVPDREDERVHININANPNMAVKFKMGANNSDNITLYGDGTLHAHYYNKGDFELYGTYRVNSGTYQLSLQDIIRKDFQFQKGGSLVFGGDPNKATLNLQAVHTVSGVSLNDLTSAQNFSKNNVRVNCLLNIQGSAAKPELSFDFDIPNVNEDEKQMVRSMISTEEDKNTQVLYLLGLGRFYPYETNAQTNQTNAAMQGLLSSTLSGQLNNILTSAIGSNNWNFGTNFSTGTLGWEDMDIEGMLSGRLFNNRLLVNGTFGYRNTPISNSNFIGDFDVQWFFTKSGHVSLKAYSETNDRYFTKSSLTTQGIGIQVQKDFSNLRDLFGTKQKNKKKDSTK